MSPEPIHGDLVEIALAKASGQEFEDFVNAFLPSLLGHAYKPLGGVKDGGADGFTEPVHENTSSVHRFLQASIEQDDESKVRKTVARLKEFGRDPRQLQYVTNREIRYLDQVEEDLTSDLDVTIRIRDLKYIKSHVNDTDGTNAAFNHHLRHLTDYLKSVGASGVIQRSRHVANPEIYVFLAQQMRRSVGNDSILTGIVDSLILWALEGTDPDQGIMRDEPAIIERIDSALPAVSTIVLPKLRGRLTALATGPRANRKVRWHRAENNFCLPWETRRFIEEENRSDEAVRVEYIASIEDRLTKVAAGLTERRAEIATELAVATVQAVFESKGLLLASYLDARDPGTTDLTIAGAVGNALDDRDDIRADERPALAEAVLAVTRGVLNYSTDIERRFLVMMSRTYSLLFTLNREPRLLEYFQDMTGDYYLYVGADQIIRAMSETYLPQTDQVVTNTLRIAAEVGATLVLTQSTVEEVVYNLRSSDVEYAASFAQMQTLVPYDMARNCPKILVRAYLYARLFASDAGVAAPSSWEAFVGKFCLHSVLRGNEAFEFVRRSLQSRYNLQYVTTDDLDELADADAVASIGNKLKEIKNPELAQNDARQAVAVYGRRKAAGETAEAHEFGYKTWWLTGESRILRATRDLVDQNRGARYIMRPEFLLYYLSLAPAASQARTTFDAVFPSQLGVKLSRRMPEDTYRELIGKMNEAAEMDEPERAAAMAHYADKMKSDFDRQYDGSYNRGIDDLTAARLDGVEI